MKEKLQQQLCNDLMKVIVEYRTNTTLNFVDVFGALKIAETLCVNDYLILMQEQNKPQQSTVTVSEGQDDADNRSSEHD